MFILLLFSDLALSSDQNVFELVNQEFGQGKVLTNQEKANLKHCMDTGKVWNNKTSECLEWEQISVIPIAKSSKDTAPSNSEDYKRKLLAKKQVYSMLQRENDPKLQELKLLFRSLPKEMEVILDEVFSIYLSKIPLNTDIDILINTYVTDCLSLDGIEANFIADLLKKDIEVIFRDSHEKQILIL